MPPGPTAAVVRPQGADVDGVRPAVDGVGPAVARAFHDLLRLDDLGDGRVPGVGLGVDDVDARAAQARHNQITPFQMRVGGIGAEGRTAGVPAEVVQLVSGVRHLQRIDDTAVARRVRIQIHHTDGIGFIVAARIQGGDVSQTFRRRLAGHAG